MGRGWAALLGVALLATGATVVPVAGAAGLPEVASGARPGPDVLYAPAPRAPQLQNTGIWKAPPVLVSSAIAYRGGEWIYQDFLHDDRGAAGVPDPGDPHDVGGFLFSPKTGTLTYPTDEAFADNAADLVELRVKALPDGSTAFRVTLNSLADPERTAFTITLGDGDGSSDLPHGAGVRSSASHYLTVHGATAELRESSPDRVVPIAPTVTVDRERRQFEVRVPAAALDFGSAQWLVGIGVGLWDPAAGAYLAPGTGATATAPGGASPGGARLFNVGPRVDEPFPDVTQFGAGVTIADAAVGGIVDGAWWREKHQADALARGDISRFRQPVDFAKLRAGTDDEEQVPKTGPLNRILASAYTSGQGIDHTKVCFDLSSQLAAGAACEGRMQGQLQPYSLYVPPGGRPAAGYGFTLLLHSLSANYNQYTDSRNQSQVALRSEQTSLVATPNGRGPDGFYAGVPEADAFEVWADVARHYELDPRYAAVTGYSMGGFGTFRLLARWPDLFSRGWSVVGAPGSVGDQLASLRNTPLMTWNALADELVNIQTSEEGVTELTAAGVRFRHLLFPVADHLTLATNDEYGLGAAFLGDHRVERDPRHVSFVVDPREDNGKATAVADHAYWLSGLRVRDAATSPTGTIDVRSAAFGTGDPEVLPVTQGSGVLEGGSRGPTPFTTRERAFGEAPAAPAQDALVVRATNISAATVDARRAKVSCSPALDVQSDGPLDLRISCAAPKRCTSRRRVTVTLPRLRGRARADRFTQVTVKVGARKARTTRLARGRRTATVDLRGLRATRVRVTITARTRTGRTVRLVRTYRTCARR